jgi:light-regulated signal transduction histidine kinase (bacteriophytochrome)
MVTSYLQLLRDRTAAALDQRALGFLTQAVDGATRMRALILALLDYSRLDRNWAPEALDVTGALDEALANLKTTIDENGATVEHGPLPRVLGDRIQLVRLFQNLIGNAIKFRGAQPLRIEVGLREGAADVLEICVADNGIGIEPRFAERIFGLFQRLHVREQYPGTGIGLAICKRIVERHGGTIRCESSPGKGATFVISLPRKASSWS